MKELVFVGMGLNDERGITLQGLQEVEKADSVFMETYTSLLPLFSMTNFERQSARKVSQVSRKDLEDDNGKIILEAAAKDRTVLLVPGDPMMATTHVALAVEAAKRGIKTRIVHGASIMSAAIGSCGLQNYKFGKTVTIPFPETATAETPYDTIAENKHRDLHTLCLLDIDIEKRRFLTIQEALGQLGSIEETKMKEVVTGNTLCVALARIGSPDAFVKAERVDKLLRCYDFGKPPYTIIFPGKLHFMEAEALANLAGAPKEIEKEAR